MPTLTETARAFADAFETKKRDDGTEFLTLQHSAPGWMTDAVRAVHDGRMPNDCDYTAASGIADAIAETLEYDSDADLDDAKHERVDGLVPVYNSERVAWLADNLGRHSYVDDARDEGLMGENAGIFDQLGVGIYMHLSQSWDSVMAAINEVCGDDVDGYANLDDETIAHIQASTDAHNASR